MKTLRDGSRSGVAVLLALCLGAAASWAAGQVTPEAAQATPEAQATPDASRPQKSVRGKLTRVDKALNGLFMKTEAGENLAWRFGARVIAEAAGFKPGDPVIVIYRQIAVNEKRVTAVAFPGSASTPIYVNTTGSRVVVRGAPAVDGVCGLPGAGPVTEATIPLEGRAEVLDACWCCAVPGESCTPGNRTGLGRALLVYCFK